MIDLMRGEKKYGHFSIDEDEIIFMIDLDEIRHYFALKEGNLIIGDKSFHYIDEILVNQLVGLWESEEEAITFGEDNDVRVEDDNRSRSGLYAVLSETEILMNLEGNAIQRISYSIDGNRLTIGNLEYSRNNVKLQWGKTKGAVKYKIYRKKAKAISKAGKSKTSKAKSVTTLKRNVSATTKKMLIGTWENLQSTCMADVITIKFSKNGNVTCTMPRDVYYGTYKVNGSKVKIQYKRSKHYSNTTCRWYYSSDPNLSTVVTKKGKKLRVTIDCGYTWKANLTKK